MVRNLNRPTAKRARERGAEDWRAARSMQTNPYRQGYPSRVAKWWTEGWLAAAGGEKEKPNG